MLYFFTGNSDFLIKEQIKAWKNKFISKFGDFHLIEIKNLDEIDNNLLSGNLISTSFLNEKKLIIINLEQEKKNEKQEEKRQFILSILDKVSPDNIVLFYLHNPDKRSKIYKGFQKICNTKEFNIIQNHEIKQIISNKYPNKISANAIDTLIEYKSGNLNKIISEIEKLLITTQHIEAKDITKNISAELEGNIFQIIDDIMNKNILSAIQKIHTTLDDTNIYAFYNNLLANLRTSVYILTYKYTLQIKPSEIKTKLQLGSRGFLVDKTYKISTKTITNLYIGLINIEKQMKTGKLIDNEDTVFQNEIEKCIMKI